MPTASASTTSARLLALLSMLQVRRDWPGTVLAERLSVSERTVRRDVDRLRELGYVVHAVKGPDGGYRLEAGSQLPPMLFDEEQAVALAVALRIAVSAGAGIEEGAARALVTLRQVMPSRLRRRVDALEVTAAGGSSTVDTEVLLALSGAIRGLEEVRFDYASPGREPVLRRVQPHHLVVRGGRWYLVGWSSERADWRTYRVDRLSLRIPNGPRFARREVPGGSVTEFLAARFKGSDSGWPCTGEVVLGLPLAEVAPFVGEGAAEEIGPARTRLVAGSWSWAALAASLARFDAEIEVVGPQKLRDAFAGLASRAARAVSS
ncbi:helix-turn-helix transcriptional regulator [Lentzea sp. NPDC058450]|uniref:helix-turn-helix transcriptional regulator n=1 Tax=Lentzea sp. NPDC058450 TaxID=3346505 RepID=UPI0036463933